MAKITEKEAKKLGFETTNHIGGFPMDVRMLFVWRYTCKERLDAAIIDGMEFKDPGAAEELKKYLMDITLKMCKKYMERFVDGDQGKFYYLKDCVKNKQMYFLSEADIEKQFEEFNPEYQYQDDVEENNVVLKVVPKVVEKKDHVSSFINNHNPYFLPINKHSKNRIKTNSNLELSWGFQPVRSQFSILNSQFTHYG